MKKEVADQNQSRTMRPYQNPSRTMKSYQLTEILRAVSDLIKENAEPRREELPTIWLMIYCTWRSPGLRIIFYSIITGLESSLMSLAIVKHVTYVKRVTLNLPPGPRWWLCL